MIKVGNPPCKGAACPDFLGRGFVPITAKTPFLIILASRISRDTCFPCYNRKFHFFNFQLIDFKYFTRNSLTNNRRYQEIIKPECPKTRIYLFHIPLTMCQRSRHAGLACPDFFGDPPVPTFSGASRD